MGIKGMTDRDLDLPIIGKIKKGEMQPTKSGQGMRPVDLDYFRVLIDDNEKATQVVFKHFYKERPRELNVFLPFNEIDRVWDAWLKAFTASRQIAVSDGEFMQYLVDTTTGLPTITNGVNGAGERVPHMEIPGKQKNGKPLKWKASGTLKVIIPELRRAAYLVLYTTSAWDIINLSKQLKAIKQFTGGKLAGTKLLLKRRPQMVSCPKGDNPAERMLLEKWLINIEIHPEHVDNRIREYYALAAPTIELPPQLEANVALEGEYDDDISPDDFGQMSIPADEEEQLLAQVESVALPRELAGQKTEGVQIVDDIHEEESILQETFVAEEPPYPKEPAAEPPTQDPLPPRVVLEKFLKHSIETFEDDIGTELTAAQKSLMRMAICMCFVGQEQSVVNDKYKTVLFYLTGVRSTSNRVLDLAMFKAVVEVWLRCKRASNTDPYYLGNPNAEKEAEAIVAAALIGEGQQELDV